MHTTQPSLLIRLRGDDNAAAWERFVELYTPLMFFWARRVNLPIHDARDLVQDVFAILIEKLPLFEYQQNKSFRAWLRTIAMNKWRERLRKKSARPVDDQQLATIQYSGDVEKEWEAEYQTQIIKRALEIMQTDFEPATWKACWEFVVIGRPASEIAKELNTTENSIYLAKGRVLRRLRQELAGLMD